MSLFVYLPRLERCSGMEHSSPSKSCPTPPPHPLLQIPAPGKTKPLLGDGHFTKVHRNLTAKEKTILDVDNDTKTKSCCKLLPSISLQAIALKIAQEISPPVPQPIFHLHGGKDFL